MNRTSRRSRGGRELWVAIRGEERIAISGVKRMIDQLSGTGRSAISGLLPTINGPSQVWFNADGSIAFVASQKVAKVDVLEIKRRRSGHSHPKRITTTLTFQPSLIRYSMILCGNCALAVEPSPAC